MQDISELQRRLAAALERIGAGLDGLDRIAPEPTAPDDAPNPELDAALADLDAERAVTAQLQERIQANRDRAEAQMAELRTELERAQAVIAELERDRGRMKAVNDALRDSNAALRAANEAGLGDDSLINTAMQTELDALRQVRASDRAELDAIVRLLEPALAEPTSEERAENA